MQKNSERSVRTQTKILKAATQLARIKGWENTTIRNICTAAEVSIGAFYHHFASKQDLVNHSFLLFDATLNDNLPSGEVPPLDAIKDVLLTQTSFIVQEAGTLITEYYKNILTDEKKSAANPNRMYYQRVLYYARQAQAEGLFQKGYTPEYITEFLIKFVRGCMIDWCLHNYEYDVVDRTSTEIDLIIRALRVK